MANGKAPVDDVGGNRNEGPWPEEVEEIAEGKAYNRPVELADGSTQEVNATVVNVHEFVRPDGTPTDGYAVTYQYDDQTLGGGN